MRFLERKVIPACKWLIAEGGGAIPEASAGLDMTLILAQRFTLDDSLGSWTCLCSIKHQDKKGRATPPSEVASRPYFRQHQPRRAGISLVPPMNESTAESKTLRCRIRVLYRFKRYHAWRAKTFKDSWSLDASKLVACGSPHHLWRWLLRGLQRTEPTEVMCSFSDKENWCMLKRCTLKSEIAAWNYWEEKQSVEGVAPRWSPICFSGQALGSPITFLSQHPQGYSAMSSQCCKQSNPCDGHDSENDLLILIVLWSGLHLQAHRTGQALLCIQEHVNSIEPEVGMLCKPVRIMQKHLWLRSFLPPGGWRTQAIY